MPLFDRRDRTGRSRGRRTAPRVPPLDEQIDWRAYDEIAGDYATVLAPRTEVVARDLVALMGIPAGARVLDVGTGTGVAARVAAKAAGPDGLVVGVDTSGPMLARAVRDGGGPTYACGGAIDLPFRDATFGFVLASFVLGHFTKYDTALFDMLRVLVPAGRMGVATWGPEEDEFSRAWQDVAEHFGTREMLRDARRKAMPWADHFASRHRLKDALYAARLREIEVQHREYRFPMSREDYLVGRETSATGRFLRQMLGERLWDRFRAQTREVFVHRFPERFNDFRDVNLAVGTKP